VGNILVSKGIVDPDELEGTIFKSEAALALQLFINQLSYKEDEDQEEPEFPENARIFGE